MDDSSNSDKKASYTIAASHTNPSKKVHCIANKRFVVIDDDIAKHLGISESDSWLEQIKTDDGILLRKRHYSSHELGGAA